MNDTCAQNPPNLGGLKLPLAQPAVCLRARTRTDASLPLLALTAGGVHWFQGAGVLQESAVSKAPSQSQTPALVAAAWAHADDDDGGCCVSLTADGTLTMHDPRAATAPRWLCQLPT